MTKKEKIMIVITGLPGSGKTSIAKEIRKNQRNKRPSIVVNGDDIRNIFILRMNRNKLALPYYKFAKTLIRD